jgi:hypothetical protein
MVDVIITVTVDTQCVAYRMLSRGLWLRGYQEEKSKRAGRTLGGGESEAHEYGNVLMTFICENPWRR